MLEVPENEIALRKLFGGTAQLRTLEGTLHLTHPIFDADILQPTVYTGNSPETGFSLWRLLNSCVSYEFSILHSYFHYCLSFQCCHQA